MSRKLDQVFVSLFQLGLSIHHLSQKMERRLGLSVGQWCLLKRLIDMPATTAQALAGAVGVHPSTLTQSMKRLEERGLLFICEDPKDSRKKLISITRSGKLALDDANAVLFKALKSLESIDPDLVALRAKLETCVLEF